jgi:hypothetical protein
MKKSNLLLPIVLIGGALAYLFIRNKKAAGENLRFEPVDIQIDTPRSRASLFTRLYYKVKINLINNEQAAVNVRNVLLNATANGGPLGTLTSSQPFSVPAKGNQVVELQTSFNIFGAALIIKNILINRQPLTVNITGYVDTDLGRVNITFNKEVKFL